MSNENDEKVNPLYFTNLEVNKAFSRRYNEEMLRDWYALLSIPHFYEDIQNFRKNKNIAIKEDEQTIDAYIISCLTDGLSSDEISDGEFIKMISKLIDEMKDLLKKYNVGDRFIDIFKQYLVVGDAIEKRIDTLTFKTPINASIDNDTKELIVRIDKSILSKEDIETALAIYYKHWRNLVGGSINVSRKQKTYLIRDTEIVRYYESGHSKLDTANHFNTNADNVKKALKEHRDRRKQLGVPFVRGK